MIRANFSKQLITQGCTQSTTIEGLQDDIGGGFLNTWTNIVMTLVDDDGNPQTGCIQIPMTYIGSSNGNYRAIYGDNNFYPQVGTGYKILIDGSQSGAFLHLELIAEVIARQG